MSKVELEPGWLKKDVERAALTVAALEEVKKVRDDYVTMSFATQALSVARNQGYKSSKVRVRAIAILLGAANLLCHGHGKV